MVGPALTLTLHQKLCMTPQLKQAIALLPLSAMELKQHIDVMLEKNPFLERVDEPFEAGQYPSYGDTLAYEGKTHIEESLHSYVEWQLMLSRLSADQKKIGLAIIGNLTETGYLDCTPEELRDCLLPEFPNISHQTIEKVRLWIQRLDPCGIASWNMSDCLLAQCELQFSNHPEKSWIMAIIKEYLPAVAKKDWDGIQKRLGIDNLQLQSALLALQQLDPKPGLQIGERVLDLKAPDVLVVYEEKQWTVQLNQGWYPQLQIQKQIGALLKQVKTAEEKQYIRHHEQEARFFLKSLAMRHETLLKVSKAIVEHQTSFFEQGESAMVPLLLEHIAEKVGMHISTISRVTQNKCLACPRGVFDLKYFFCKGLAQAGNLSISSTAIRALIKEWVQNENPNSPLNDEKLTDLLRDKGICLVRRTVAKYRSALGIPTANLRKNERR